MTSWTPPSANGYQIEVNGCHVAGFFLSSEWYLRLLKMSRRATPIANAGSQNWSIVLVLSPR
jgi:hypothetical protein